MNDCATSRNVLLYRIYTLFCEPLFWGPILVLSLQQLAHMSLREIYYMEAVVLGISVVLDIPAGAVADILGRKKTLIVARILLATSVYFFTTMTCPLDAWAGNIVWAVGFSLQSGADSSILYDTLKSNGREGQYKRIEGRAVGARLMLVACTSVSVGYLAAIDLRLPLWIGFPLTLIPLGAACLMTEPPRAPQGSMRDHLCVLARGLMSMRTSVEIRWMVCFAAFVGTVSKVWFFTYNPYFELVQIDVAYYGLIFCGLNVVAWSASHYAQTIEDRLGERYCVLGMVLCIGLPIIVMGAVPLQICAGLVLIQNIVRGFLRPFVGDYMHRHVESDVRATMLSAQSATSNLASIVGLTVFGVCTEYLTLPQSLMVLGVTALSAGALSYRTYVTKIA